MRWLRGLADLLFPPTCCACRHSGAFPLCSRCLESFRRITTPLCQKCGCPLPDIVHRICPACRIRPLYFHQARSAAIYEGTLREALHALKFRRCRSLAAPLGRMMAAVALAHPDISSARTVVPVPLHPQRQRERGFNQSELLAYEVGRVLRLPVSSGALRRITATAAQSTLQFNGRRMNVRNVFQASSAIRPDSVLLVDDVISTGFTASECAKQLLAAGAERVVVLTAARAVALCRRR